MPHTHNTILFTRPINHLTGLLTEHKNKDSDRIAIVVPDTKMQPLHNLLTSIGFYEYYLKDQESRTMTQLSGLTHTSQEGKDRLLVISQHKAFWRSSLHHRS